LGWGRKECKKGTGHLYPLFLCRKDRIRSIKKLCEKVKGQKCDILDILEGLFFRDNKKYLSLIQYEGEDNAYIIGADIILRNIPFSNVSSWRRLAIGIGLLVSKGDIT